MQDLAEFAENFVFFLEKHDWIKNIPKNAYQNIKLHRACVCLSFAIAFRLAVATLPIPNKDGDKVNWIYLFLIKLIVCSIGGVLAESATKAITNYFYCKGKAHLLCRQQNKEIV